MGNDIYKEVYELRKDLDRVKAKVRSQMQSVINTVHNSLLKPDELKDKIVFDCQRIEEILHSNGKE